MSHNLVVPPTDQKNPIKQKSKQKGENLREENLREEKLQREEKLEEKLEERNLEKQKNVKIFL